MNLLAGATVERPSLTPARCAAGAASQGLRLGVDGSLLAPAGRHHPDGLLSAAGYVAV